MPMLQWAEARHGHGTRAARGGALMVTTTDHKFPLSEGAWGLMLYSFRRASTAGFSGMYGAFRCEDGGIGSVGPQGEEGGDSGAGCMQAFRDAKKYFGGLK